MVDMDGGQIQSRCHGRRLAQPRAGMEQHGGVAAATDRDPEPARRWPAP
jgi:hypothetical protein